jgi:hypothetical protein
MSIHKTFWQLFCLDFFDNTQREDSNAKCCLCFALRDSYLTLSVVMLSVIMLSVIMLSVIMLSVIVLSVIVLSVIVLSVIILSVVVLLLGWGGSLST